MCSLEVIYGVILLEAKWYKAKKSGWDDIIMRTFQNFSNTLPDETWDNLFDSSLLVRNLYFAISIVPATYLIVHHVLLRFVSPYNQIKRGSDRRQTVIIHHVVEFIIYSCLFLPLTSLVISALFEEQSLEELDFSVANVILTL